ncbi:Abi family protein [Lacticaseibacillus paracasei]|uniref:Abi family protein n=1 Tax=Lacticaseibacillus paracasei TaxID=1597 RepID=UPI00124B661C|nr:Abi family protein [Lacticaseibacillus paracasei]KAB1963821.1 Abi family protein [Lacticaseibacillus paracasei]MCT3332989.1 Abi family protein [Lacticaseibacillus paracasei]
MNQSNQKQASYIGEIKANTRPWETLHVTLTSIEEENQVQADLRVLGETFPIVAEKTGSAKKPADFDQMVTHLRKRIEITDADKPRLHRLIHEKMYFRVAYFSKLLSTRTESRHATLDDLIQLFEFDNYVRSSIARLTPDIEQFAKATLVELLLERDLDSEVYLQKSLYKYASSSDKRNLDKTLSICASEVKANRTTNDAIKHHIEHHGGHIPIWVLFDVLPFGKFNMLTARFQKEVLRDWIKVIEKSRGNHNLVLQTGPKTLPSFLQTVQLLRNAAAHNARIYGKKFVFNPSLKITNSYWKTYDRKGFEVSPKTVSQQIHSLFTGLMVVRYFYACMDDNAVTNWEKFLVHLIKRVEKTSFLNLKGYLGFPDNWKELLSIRQF